MGSNLYIFLDEGGNLDFSPSGTKHFTLTSVCKFRPFTISHMLGKLKFDLIDYGLDFEYFHCTKNNRYVRDKVFKMINDNIATLRIDALIVEKRKTGPALQTHEEFYPRMIGYLLRYVVRKAKMTKIDEVIVITDTIPVRRKRDVVEKTIKTTLKSMLPSTCKFRILHHASRSNVGLQIADFCNWGIYRKWEAGDDKYYNQIKGGIKSEFEIFKKGATHYY